LTVGETPKRMVESTSSTVSVASSSGSFVSTNRSVFLMRNVHSVGVTYVRHVHERLLSSVDHSVPAKHAPLGPSVGVWATIAGLPPQMYGTTCLVNSASPCMTMSRLKPASRFPWSVATMASGIETTAADAWAASASAATVATSATILAPSPQC
jgi:hypothetical protein